MTWNGHRFLPGAPVNGSRALGTQYTPSASNWVAYFITVQLVNASTQSATVAFTADSANPPTIVRTSASSNVVGTTIQQMVWFTAPGDNVKLVASGTGTATIVQQFEIPLHSATE